MLETPTYTTKPGDALNLIAAQIFPGEDVGRFTEILDQIDEPEDAIATLFSELAEGQILQLPSVEQIENFAQPVLSRIADSVGGAKGFLGQVEDTITSISGKLPPQLQGYAKEALELVGEANEVIGDVEGFLDRADEEVLGKLRDYGGQPTKLVSWLLGGKA
ncbi:MAG TPA: hypothetical protein V6C63_17700 [Allocoleopsis sp.]